MGYPWSKTTPLLQATETVLQSGAQLSTCTIIDERQWHLEAIALSEIAQPEEFSEAAFAFLKDLPYQDTIDAIQAIKWGRPNEHAFSQIKKARQLFFIGRDLILLTSKEKPNSSFTWLADSCRNLGIITDTRGEQGRMASIGSILELQANPPQPQVLKSQEEFPQEVKNRLHITDQRITTTSYEAFHKARQDFRRVTALGIIGVAALGLGNYFDFATRGVALSHQYGQVKDFLAGRQRTPTLLGSTERIIT
jgi:hypothetical protein